MLTVALAEAILSGTDYTVLLKDYFRRYPQRGYGASFSEWASSNDSRPYNSWGNGAAMRIAPVGFAFNTAEEVLTNARKYTEVTHNHPEGVKGAQATALAIFLARSGGSKTTIKEEISAAFGYDLSRTCDKIRATYVFNESCQGTVPEAITAFLESTDFESAIRLAISLGGDSDTLACIAGELRKLFMGRFQLRSQQEPTPSSTSI